MQEKLENKTYMARESKESFHRPQILDTLLALQTFPTYWRQSQLRFRFSESDTNEIPWFRFSQFCKKPRGKIQNLKDCFHLEGLSLPSESKPAAGTVLCLASSFQQLRPFFVVDQNKNIFTGITQYYSETISI